MATYGEDAFYSTRRVACWSWFEWPGRRTWHEKNQTLEIMYMFNNNFWNFIYKKLLHFCGAIKTSIEYSKKTSEAFPGCREQACPQLYQALAWLHSLNVLFIEVLVGLHSQKQEC
jgi:hypothetical protein